MTGPVAARFGPLVAGLLVAFSMPPWGWWPLAFLGVALLDFTIGHNPATNDNEGRGARWFSRLQLAQGFVFGLAWLVPAMFWMWDLTPPGYVIACVLFSLYYAVGFAMIPTAGAGRRRVGLVSMLVLVAVARWSWPFGGVPLATLAMSQADAPLGPTVRTFGPLVLVGLVGVVGVGLSALAERQWRAVGVSVAVVLGLVALTAVAPFGSVIDTIDVAVVQGGGPQNTRAISSDARAVFDRHVAATENVQLPVDLILWPENVIDMEGPFEENVEYEEIVALAQEFGAPIIPGITEGFRGDDPYYTNASVFVTPEGATEARYDKVLRVPYGEYVPFRSIVEFAAPAAMTSRDARAGSGPAVLETDMTTFGISISWEIFFDTRARDAVRNGGTILLNPTNGSSYWLTILQTQQVASSRLRAMETGRYVLQAAPTGFSAIVTPDGDVIDRSGVSEQKVIQGTVELRSGLTWAVRFGRWPMVIAALVAFGLVRYAPAQRRNIAA